MRPGEVYRLDRERHGGGSLFSSHALRFTWLLRRCQASRNLLWRLLLARMRDHYGLEVPWRARIGAGLYLGHAFNITVNPAAVIGRNCNLHKGATIGQESRGARKGAPTLGDRVWVGANSTVVGAVTVGDDVLIAPNTYVNRDVPSHSVVLGSPCRVIPRDNATEGYVNRCV